MVASPVCVVTGGAGFIGSHMVHLLVAEGFRVRVIDTLVGGRESNLAGLPAGADVTLDRTDIRALTPDSAIFSDARHVFHFAGLGDIVPSIDKPIDYMSTNVMGTVNVLEAARHAKVESFVYAASSTCYGLADTPTREDHPIDPQFPYALSKYQGEQAVMHWAKVYGLRANAVRIFNAYGPRVRTTGAYGAVFGVFLKQKLAEKPFTVVGDGTQTRDFVFVSDVARAFYLVGKSEHSGLAFNVGAGKPQPVNRLVELIGGPVVYVPKRPGEPDCTWADTTRIQTMVGWQPQVSFEDGVATMMSHIEAWRDAPLWDPASIAEATESWFKYLHPDQAGS